MFLKRAFDILLSLLGLVIFVPLFVIVALLVVIEDGRPVFFIQERVGKNGQSIKLIKFRTMKHIPDKVHADIDLLDRDPRITRIGKALRATAMDELPQLINILRGELSFVGPKPLPYVIEDEEKTKYKHLDEVPGYSERIKMLPGLTGIAQIYAPKTAGREEKFRYDNMYRSKQSLLFDIKLILVSVAITMRANWETEGKKI